MLRIKNNASVLVNSKWYYAFLALISFVFVLLFSRATSPLYTYVGYDAAMFKQMGMAVLKGKTLYLDYFDNKGCLLYLLHALCLWLGGDFVILVFQAISLTISLILLDKIISLYKEGASRFFILMLGLILLLCFYEGGDLSEEWSLPFICYPLYAFLKSFKEDKSLKTKELYYIGLCFGVIAFLRINNAVPFCGFLVCLFIGYLLKKQWKSFIINVLAFIAGVLTIAAPCFLYFYLKAGAEGVWWMVYGTFVSGFEYIGVDNIISSIHVVCYCMILLSFIILQILSQNNITKLPIIIAYILFILSFGIKCFAHYQIVMIPIYLLCISTLSVKIAIIKKCVLSLIFITMAVFLIRPMGFLVMEALGKDKYSVIYSDFHKIIAQIPENERDSICNYNTDGFGCALLYNEGLIQSNKVLYSSLSFWLKTLREDHRTLAEEKPLWVMIEHGNSFASDILFLRDNYEELYVFHYENIHIKSSTDFKVEKDIYFFRRKD